MDNSLEQTMELRYHTVFDHHHIGKLNVGYHLMNPTMHEMAISHCSSFQNEDVVGDVALNEIPGEYH